MNSGKVRIYELSRELNLDNKDLLAICEQLNISVKSHSSTITDSEAERIRAAAEKYTASPSTKPVPPRQGSHQAHGDSKGRVTAPVQKKQQIVAIKSVPRQPAEPPTPPNSYTDSQASVKPAVQLPQPKPTAPVRPPARPVVEAEKVEPTEPAVAAPPEVPVVAPAAPVSQESPVRSEPLETEPAIAAPAPVEVENPPELNTPPQRVAAVAPSKPNLSNRPILKRSRGEQAGQETITTGSSGGDGRSGSRSSAPTSPKPPVKPAVPPAKPASGTKQPGSKPGDKPVPARPQQTIVELRRPKPVRPDTAEVAATDVKGSELEPLTVELRTRPRQKPTPVSGGEAVKEDQLLQPRPTLPRTTKKGKDWDEEEEAREFASKAAKVGTKGKRRTQPDLEDEDVDLDVLLGEEEDEDTDAPVQVSLSLVRPAKPKATRQGPTKTPTATPAPQRTKRSTSRDRRDRREQEVKLEKPEKITLTGSLTVQELAAMMAIPDTEIIRTLFMKGIMATVTQTLDIETATMVAQELGVEVETGEKESQARKLTEMLDVADLENLQRRPPVVTIMGHVDHGKTSLLDSIRKTKVAQGEAGGITQHIGAYHVDVEHNGEMQQVVFLDTPGHEAFTAMRARGARVTDIAILVVAADDGVQPQTIEAISHAKAAGVPIVVAINKIDKEGAQPDRVKQELTEFGLVPEEWGGDTIMVPVSAMTGENLDTLLEMILLVSEVEELSANPDRPARGTVIEAHLDKAKGPVATLLVQNGTLHVGDVLVAGSVFGKVRAMVDDQSQRVKEAGPSFAVEVLGLADVPAAGDEFAVFEDEKEARSVSSTRTDEQRQSRLLAAMSSRRVSLNTLSARAQEGELKELNLVLKADVQGSVEAILGAFKQLPQNEVQVRVLYAAPGEITETDVDLAAASSAVIIGFNTTLAPGARQAADRLGVDVRDYNIIYKLLDDIQAAMEGLLEPELVEEPLGQVEVRAVFPVGRGQVAGCYILSGKVIRNCKIRVRRGGEVVYEGNLDSLKRMKEDAREVNAGYECGIGIDDFNSWEIGDIIEAYRMISKRRTLSK
ncbi:translation initiation factor IF-2 [Leptodesmis sichuanensis]|uniref:translation initiation factor IF-2 n=1 Tax=Leptodesmis sichuanensis TaxID=2906798 RepID=UPI001EFF86D6|nr:translation initiation factor IF-2 [Leptodesmis sichuanensis]UIE39502.1 translation initiation factor IF-2 [Leptodesmis sichuanensis A121]